jgi:antitoxin ParD1/3/4
MQRINLGKPYDDYIAQLIDTGYYSSATEILRDALREKMEKESLVNKKSRLLQLLKEGEDDFAAGRFVEYTDDLLENLHKKAIENSLNGKPIRDEVRP